MEKPVFLIPRFLKAIVWLAVLVRVGSAADPIKIACVGNSITQGDWLANPGTQGYVAVLQKMLGTNYKVMNYGLSGRTMLFSAPQPYVKESKFRDLFTEKPDIITIELGTNESRPTVWTTQAVFEADYAKFVDSLERIPVVTAGFSGRPMIIPVLCTPATDNTFNISGKIITDQINPSIRKVAKAQGGSLIDIYTPMLARMNLIHDGVHPDLNGNKFLADVYYENLQNLALKQSPQTRWLWYGAPPAGAPGATGNLDTDKPMLYVFPAPENLRNGAAVLICPGGGYTSLPGLQGYEGADEAKWFNTFGVTAFVLRYRLSPYHHPIELNDAKRAMRIIRYSAAEYGIDTARIGVMGFSAGGHLAATVGTLFDAGKPSDPDPIERQKSRPDFQALIYPVITLSGPYAHTGSRDALLGNGPSQALIDSLSPQKRVTAQTPPAFLAHGDADNLVPIENSRMYDSACKAAKVPDTLVVEPGKNHGYGMDGAWPNALKDWMQKRGLLNKSVSLQRNQAQARSRGNRAVVGYAPVKGIYLVPSGFRPHAVEILAPDGRSLARFTGPKAGEFTWQPPRSGIYLVRLRADKEVLIKRVVCDRNGQ